MTFRARARARNSAIPQSTEADTALACNSTRLLPLLMQLLLYVPSTRREAQAVTAAATANKKLVPFDVKFFILVGIVTLERRTTCQARSESYSTFTTQRSN